MTKTFRKVDMGEGKSLVTIILEDEPSDDDSFIKIRRTQFLNEFTSNSILWDCQGELFQTMDMRHNGYCWVIKLTAETKQLSNDK